ncbi:MOSC domain-containing protein [Mycobacterium sp. MMS18-G62]
MAIGQVAELWRYPVKSLGGERIEQSEFSARGVHGDRLWAVRDLERDVTASARRISKLLTATARYPDPVPPDAGPGNVPDVEITFPDGTVLSSGDDEVHAKLSELAGRDVKLTALPPAEDTSLHRLSRQERDNTSIASLRTDFGVTDEEKFPDISMLRVSDLATFARYSTPPGMFVDLAPVHVLSQTSLATIGAEVGGDVEVRRFRPNVLLALENPDEDLPESHWTGARLTLGDVTLDVLMPTIRCVVPSRAQPGFEVDRRITRAVAAKAQRCLGVYCDVRSAGTVNIGDAVAIRLPKHGPLADAARRTKRLAFGLATAAADRFSR